MSLLRLFTSHIEVTKEVFFQYPSLYSNGVGNLVKYVRARLPMGKFPQV